MPQGGGGICSRSAQGHADFWPVIDSRWSAMGYRWMLIAGHVRFIDSHLDISGHPPAAYEWPADMYGWPILDASR